MRTLTVKNFGPINKAIIKMRKANVIIGPQSSGKSCILKIACHCCWVEKRIELSQSPTEFEKKDKFINGLLHFHKLEGYLKDNSYIQYESDQMSFTYAKSAFSFSWKEKRWEYKRPLLSYIPAERNIVAVIPNWYEVKFDDNNIRSFMADWETARKERVKKIDILNLKVSYRYDANNNEDKVDMDDGVTMAFTNTSSGLQSLIPLYVHLDYLTGKGLTQKAASIADENNISRMYTTLMLNFLKGMDTNDAKLEDLIDITNKNSIAQLQKLYKRLVENDHCDIFVEEPEENLFPETQYELVNWLASKINEHDAHSLFVSTHSPYIMSSFNNLLQGGEIKTLHPEKAKKVADIIDHKALLYHEDFSAYAVKDGEVHDIMDHEMGLISADELDSISDYIGSKFEKLLDL